MKDFGSAGASPAAFARASITAPFPNSRHHRPIKAPGFFSPCLARYALPADQKSAFTSSGDFGGLAGSGAFSGVSAKGGSASGGEDARKESLVLGPWSLVLDEFSRGLARIGEASSGGGYFPALEGLSIF